MSLCVAARARAALAVSRALLAELGWFGTTVCCGIELEGGVGVDGGGDVFAGAGVGVEGGGEVFAGDGVGVEGGGDVFAGVGVDGGGEVAGWFTGVCVPGMVDVPALFAGGAAWFCAPCVGRAPPPPCGVPCAAAVALHANAILTTSSRFHLRMKATVSLAH